MDAQFYGFRASGCVRGSREKAPGGGELPLLEIRDEGCRFRVEGVGALGFSGLSQSTPFRICCLRGFLFFLVWGSFAPNARRRLKGKGFVVDGSVSFKGGFQILLGFNISLSSSFLLQLGPMP